MTTMPDKPFHLQETTENDIVLPAAEDDPSVDENESDKDRKEREKREKDDGIKRVKVGKIQLDPKIDFSTYHASGTGLDSRATLNEQGMIDIWVNLKQSLPDLPKDYARSVKEYAVDPAGVSPSKLNVVIFIVGSRGDVQPYLSLALSLILKNDHRVRIATHPDFKDLILDANSRLKSAGRQGRLEFWDVGGSPKELMAYMVKNPGLLPGIESLTNGDIGSKRKMTADMLEGFHQACFSADPVSGEDFAADALISNPPAFAHVHVAEALGLPLLLSFTMPWSPTTGFAHPLVRIKSSNAEQGLTNYFSYAMADYLTWQGLGDVINSFRSSTLGLEPLSMRSGPSVLDRLKIPWTYCWSEGLIPKPHDWKEHIDISGFYFMAADEGFKPDDDLAAFLAKGDAPVYIGFGSVVVEDSAAMTKTIFDAVKKAGVRALVSAGWGGLGGTSIPDEVFILEGNIPHDWLFADDRVTAVCHHGGAGTTAIGLREGRPTIVVPFFGDQEFWGNMIHKAGAGPAPIPQKELTPDSLAAALKFVVSPSVKAAAAKMGEKIRSEKGEARGVESFHRHLPLLNMRCDLDPSRVAAWWSEPLALRLSGAAAQVLVDEGKLDYKHLEPHRAKDYDTRKHVSDPITGGAVAIFSTVLNYQAGIAQIFYNPPKGIINTTTAIPKGLLNIVTSVHEGMENIPRLLGSDVRERGKVDDFSSGIKEAGKGLFYGYADGIAGLVTEPIEGGKKEGFMGVLKGMGRSYVNVTARPAAGIVGVAALPISGAWAGFQKRFSTPREDVLRKPRQAAGAKDAQSLSAEERKRFVEAFIDAEKKTHERREEVKRRAKRLMEGDDTAMDITPEGEKDGLADAKVDESDEGRLKAAANDAKTQANAAEQRQQAAQGDGNEAIEKDSQKSAEISLAEQRGYERALKELQAKAASQ